MALNDFIVVQDSLPGAVEAADLKQIIRSLAFAKQGLEKHQGIMRHNFDDSKGAQAIDWAGLETRYGLLPGQGERLFTFVDGSIGTMNGTTTGTYCKDLTETVG